MNDNGFAPKRYKPLIDHEKKEESKEDGKSKRCCERYKTNGGHCCLDAKRKK